ncbi:D-3-phosphoglycerate dehydrogenase [Lacunisphaera limnophila]|uniref:D-3-phosphoglycerate dehydrogenase n=1 Tax=Lacunisphaera limnophila TaxID=1838286 RepID=A0A1D8AV63_9BACT|nr:hydroxyacid dehydrogenase [Lacunisphaera limnophila]AOS44789.1 D-3-phosphoglycerate dehydrogenase [Lacunisphaera limnophila]
MPPSDPSPVRILAALTGRERALFLEPVLPSQPPAASLEFTDESDLTPGRWARLLESRRPAILITGWTTPPLPAAWLAQPDCPLRYVCHVTGSVRNLVPRSFIERGGLVTNWGERISAQVAEHGLLLALAALRNQGAWTAFLARPATTRRLTELRTRTLFGLRVGLHGFGSVARALLPLLRPFGVTLAAYSAGVPEAIFAAHGVRPAASLSALFTDSDVLFECESLTPLTEGTVTASVLAALRDDAVFVNIGRGAVVDDEALVREGRAGRIRLALDVVTAEPVTPTSPFFSVPGLVLSPHIGGPTADRYADCGGHALANIARVLAGTPPEGLITLASYDRAT